MITFAGIVTRCEKAPAAGSYNFHLQTSCSQDESVDHGPKLLAGGFTSTSRNRCGRSFFRRLQASLQYRANFRGITSFARFAGIEIDVDFTGDLSSRKTGFFRL